MADAVANVVPLQAKPSAAFLAAYSHAPKECRKCGETKTDIWDNFRAHNTPNHGVHVKRVCRKCEYAARVQYEKDHREAQKAKRKAHPLTASRYRARNLKKYGLTVAQFNVLSESQNHKCAICRKENSEWHAKNYPPKLVVDHCHFSGRVRGLLCGSCNRGLGDFRDNIESMKAAIAYLERQK